MRASRAHRSLSNKKEQTKMTKLATTETVIKKIQELDKVQEQVRRGIITIREALNQRVHIMVETKEMLNTMLEYDLGN